MKIPDHLTVGGHLYKVLRDYKFKERQDIHGQTDHTALEIRLCESDLAGKFATSKIECNFIHELIHAVDNTYNNAALKEEDVVRLAEGLYQVLKVNDMLREEYA